MESRIIISLFITLLALNVIGIWYIAQFLRVIKQFNSQINRNVDTTVEALSLLAERFNEQVKIIEGILKRETRGQSDQLTGILQSYGQIITGLDKLGGLIIQLQSQVAVIGAGITDSRPRRRKESVEVIVPASNVSSAVDISSPPNLRLVSNVSVPNLRSGEAFPVLEPMEIVSKGVQGGGESLPLP